MMLIDCYRIGPRLGGEIHVQLTPGQKILPTTVDEETTSKATQPTREKEIERNHRRALHRINSKIK